MDKRPVAFRRMHGHTVPIRLKKEQAQGTAIAASGVVVAAGTGAVAARLVQGAARAENEARKAVKAAHFALNEARNMGPLFQKPAYKTYAKASHDALRTMVKSRQLLQSSIKLRNAGHAAGAAIVAAGVHRALSGTDLDKSPKAKAGIAAAAGVTTGFALRAAFTRGVNGRKTLSALKTAAKQILMKRFGG